MKKIITLLGIGMLAIAVSYFGYLSIAKPISNRIEDWEFYRASKRNLSLTTCDNQDYKAGEQLINQGSKSEIDTNSGFLILRTENPLGWTNEQFRSFSDSKCNKNGWVPVRAYPDKLLWKNNCPWYATVVGCGIIENDLQRWEEQYAQSSYRIFNEAGIRFPIAEHILHTQTGLGAVIFSFYTEGNMIPDTSNITLFIPSDKTVSSDYNPVGEVPIEAVKKMINWKNLQGDRYVYDQKWKNGTYTWEGNVTKEIYPVSFSEHPITLVYTHSIHDDTLEDLWIKIHSETKMDLDSNLVSYQAYVSKNRRQ